MEDMKKSDSILLELLEKMKVTTKIISNLNNNTYFCGMYLSNLIEVLQNKGILNDEDIKHILSVELPEEDDDDDRE